MHEDRNGNYPGISSVTVGASYRKIRRKKKEDNRSRGSCNFVINASIFRLAVPRVIPDADTGWSDKRNFVDEISSRLWKRCSTFLESLPEKTHRSLLNSSNEASHSQRSISDTTARSREPIKRVRLKNLKRRGTAFPVAAVRIPTETLRATSRRAIRPPDTLSCLLFRSNN